MTEAYCNAQLTPFRIEHWVIEDHYFQLQQNGVVSSAFIDSNWCEKK
jgi:hypothetical protein